MNIKKYLQQRAEKDAEKLLTEEDRQFCRNLFIAESAPQQPVIAKPKTFKIKVLTSLAAVLVIGIVLGVTLPLVLNRNIPVGDIHYKEENIVQTACTIEDVNDNAKYFQIIEAENMSLFTQLKYDSVSKDKLYYIIEGDTGIAVFTLYIVINKNYDFEFSIGNELLIKPEIYNLNYEVIKGNNTANYLGVINNGTETAYINYNQIYDLGEQVFFAELQSVLTVKN